MRGLVLMAHELDFTICATCVVRNRSHECKEEGYEVEHNGKCITIFSAPNYCDQMGNKGAFIHLDKTLQVSMRAPSPTPRPTDPVPRAY